MTPGFTGSLRPGLPIIVSHHMPTRREQWRRPRSRSRRIRRKWEKDARNWRSVEMFPHGYMVAGRVVVSPAGYERLMRALEVRW